MKLLSEREIIELLSNKIEQLEAERDELLAEIAELVVALECTEVVFCGVGVPHPGERKLLQDGVELIRTVLAKVRKP